MGLIFSIFDPTLQLFPVHFIKHPADTFSVAVGSGVFRKSEGGPAICYKNSSVVVCLFIECDFLM